MLFSELFLCCFPLEDKSCHSEKPLAVGHKYQVAYRDFPTKADLVNEIVANLRTADRNNDLRKIEQKPTLHASSWYNDIAAAVLAAIEEIIRLGEEMGPAMKSAYEKATIEVNKITDWAEEHPEMAAVVVTLISLGVLAITMPWLMAWLGFAEEGIVEGSWAAGWQATYNGFVPKGSLFSYLQSLGTRIGCKWVG